MVEQARIWKGSFRTALVLENPDPSLDRLLTGMGIEVERIDRALSDGELVARLTAGQHNLIFKRSRTPITREAIKASRNLFAIMLCCIGDDSVDKQAAADHGVLVLNDPISNGRSVAELVLGEMICLSRRVIEANTETKHHRFSKSSARRYEMAGKKLGILGLGNIGKQVAQLGAALDMEIYFYDSRELAVEVGIAMRWRPCHTLSELFQVANVVAVHLSAEDWRGRSNEGLLKFQHFKEMGAAGKSGPKLLLNASRGFLYAPEDLKRAVEEGYIDAAFVDVFPKEPKSSSEPWDNPYGDCDRVFTTPHIGAATQEAQPRIATHIARTTRLLNDTGTVRDCVFRPGRQIGTDPAAGGHIVAVVHSDARGTKKAVDDAIFEAGASNLQSNHRDFPRFGIAYDLNVLDQPLGDEAVQSMIRRAVKISGDARAIRSVRTFAVPDSVV